MGFWKFVAGCILLAGSLLCITTYNGQRRRLVNLKELQAAARRPLETGAEGSDSYKEPVYNFDNEGDSDAPTKGSVEDGSKDDLWIGDDAVLLPPGWADHTLTLIEARKLRYESTCGISQNLPKCEKGQRCYKRIKDGKIQLERPSIPTEEKPSSTGGTPEKPQPKTISKLKDSSRPRKSTEEERELTELGELFYTPPSSPVRVRANPCSSRNSSVSCETPRTGSPEAPGSPLSENCSSVDFAFGANVGASDTP